MRPIHLGLAALLLVAALAALWFALDLSPGIARAGVLGGGAAGESGDGTLAGGGGESAPAGRDDAAATRIAVAAAEPAAEAAASVRKDKDLPRLSGRVVDPAGKGIAGAVVFAASGDFWLQIPLDLEPEGMPKGWIRVERTATDAEGRFAFETLRPGTLRIAVRAAGFAPRYEDHLELPDRPELALPDIAMATGVTLAGKVVDAEGRAIEGATLLVALDGGSSIPGSSVTLPGRGIPLATTLAGGEFLIDQLAAGPWKMIVDAPGHAIAEEEGRTEKPGERQEGLVFQVETGFEILGRVRAEFGALPEGLRIGARPSPEREGGPRSQNSGSAGEAEEVQGAADTRARYASCGPDGSFVVRGVKNGVRYGLTLSRKSDDPGGWRRLRGVDPVFAWAGQRGIDLAYRPESALVFRVLDARTRAPITAFCVWAGERREQPLRDEKGQTVHEFADGRARFGDLHPKRGGPGVLLRVAADGYKELERKGLALEPGQELDLGDLALEAGPVVRVRVVDDRTGAPIEGARVVIGTKTDEELAELFQSAPDTDLFGESGLHYARTDRAGRARLSSLPGKSVTACAGARGFRPSEVYHGLLPEDRDEEIELKLKHGGTVAVRVRDGDGQPVEGVGVEHKGPATPGADEESGVERGSSKSDAAGSVRFEALVPGTHAFRVNDRGTDAEWYDGEEEQDRAGWTESVVSEGSTTTLDFVAPSRGGLYGEVREGGKPLEGARLHLVGVPLEGEEQQGWFAPGNNDPFTCVADHGGQYRYEGLRCGSYRLQVSHPSRRMPAVFDVEITKPARAFDVDLDVASIEGHVTGEDGRPLSGIEVQAHVTESEGSDEDGSWRLVVTEDERGNPRVDYRQESRPATRTDAGGRYFLRGIATGRPLAVTAGGEMVVLGVVEGITLGPDEARRGVDFALKPAGVIEVTLAGKAPPGRGRAWFEVRASRTGESGEAEPVQTGYLGDWNRSCRLGSLEPGKYKVAIAPGGQEQAEAVEEQEVEVVAGQVARIAFQPR